MWNIIIGIVFIIGGLSGELVLRGTNSSNALVFVGAGFIIIGVIQVYRRTRKGKLNEELSKNPVVIAFFKFTIESWEKGSLDKLNTIFKKEVRNKNYEKFTKIYGPFMGSALEKYFLTQSPQTDEFLIGFGEDDKGDDRGWFVLTNFHLMIKDGTTNEHQMIKLNEIESFKFSSNIAKPTVFNLKNNSAVEIKRIKHYPTEKYLQFAIDLNK